MNGLKNQKIEVLHLNYRTTCTVFYNINNFRPLLCNDK